MSIFRERTAGLSALDEYMEVKRREFVASSDDAIGAADSLLLREDVTSLSQRIEHQLVESGRSSVCYLVMGRVQSGKTGHQLGMLAWAADTCDVAVVFTGVTEALNGQTSSRVQKDLGTLPSSPVATITVPTRTGATRDPSFLESVLKRTRQRREYRDGEAMWPERLPILVAMKTKPRVDAIKWLFQQVSAQLGEGVTALIIDDEADQASPNAATRKGEEAATYSELKALRDAATHHVWLSYTATPQAIFLTERDGALRPDFCAVSRPGANYFGLQPLMSATHAPARIDVHDWPPQAGPTPAAVPSSLKCALSDVLTAAWLRLHDPDAFYRRDGGPATEGMRSVQMLIHTSSMQRDHAKDYELVQTGLEQLKNGIEKTIVGGVADEAPPELSQSWNRLAQRVVVHTGGEHALPPLGLEQLWDLGQLFSRVETRVVNSDPSRPTAPAGPLPTDRSGWEAHPIWVVIGGDILGRGLTIPQLVTTYFTRIPQTAANEDTVAQQMRFCGYRRTYAHVITVHALPDIFSAFDYLAQVERALISTAQDWEARDKNLKLDEPALWYVSRPTNRMRPTRLAVRDRDLEDTDRSQQVLSLRQFLQPASFVHNARRILAWTEAQDAARGLEGWLLTECGAPAVEDLLAGLRLTGRDDGERDVALELLNPRLGDLGLANLPFAVFVRGLDVIREAAARTIPDIGQLPVRRLAAPLPPGDAVESWRRGWSVQSEVRPAEWYDSARLAVPHVGEAQRKPIRALKYDAVSVLVEPLAVYATDRDSRDGAGLAISILTPDDFTVRVIGVSARAAT